MDWILAVFTAFIGGGAFKSLVDYFINRRKNNKKSNFEKLFDNIHKIYSILNNIKRTTFSKRVMVVQAENGGGIPSADSKLVSSILYETYDYPFKSMKDQWQNQRLSENHLLFLRKMYMDGSAVIITEELEDSDLKDALKSNEVMRSECYLIADTKKKLYYLVLHYHQIYDEEPVHRNIIRSSINKLKPIFLKRGEV